MASGPAAWAYDAGRTISPPRAAVATASSGALVREILIASGTCGTDLSEAELQLERFAARLLAERGASTADASERQQAESIHRFLHREILHGEYVKSASSLAGALAGHDFNCASTSAIFLALAELCGLECSAVSVPGHVWCRLMTAEGPLDIETTCPTWFEILDDNAGGAADEIGSTSSLVTEHRERVDRGRLLDRAGLVAIFYFNRGVRLLDAGEYGEALGANLAALTLDSACPGAYANLLATINNWSLALAAEGDRAAGRQLLTQGLALHPDYGPFRENLEILSRD